MSIIDNKPYKLDVYDMKVSNSIYKCAESEKACKSMVSKLVFYDRDEILKMHADSIGSKGEKYDISKLKPIEFLKDGEGVEKVVPLEGNWLGVFFKDKKTNKRIEQKLMYVSPEGEGYITDDMSSALAGFVPEEVYFEHLENSPQSFVMLDEKYFDGTHDEFLSRFYAKTRQVLTKILSIYINGSADNLNDKDFANRKDLSLEDISYKIIFELRRKEKQDDFGMYKSIDFIYSTFGGDRIIKDEQRVNERLLDERQKENVEFLKSSLKMVKYQNSSTLKDNIEFMISRYINNVNIEYEDVEKLCVELSDYLGQKTSGVENITPEKIKIYINKIFTILTEKKEKQNELQELEKAEIETEKSAE